MLPADARYEVSIGRNGSNKLLSPLAIALAREALERANAGLDVAGSVDGRPPEFCFESVSASIERIRRHVSSNPP